MKKPFITVIGNVGSGKTTFSRMLAEELDGIFVAADELYKTNPFFNDAIVDRTRWSLASDIWFLTKRVEMAKDVEKTLKKSLVVQDSGIPMSWVYSNSRLSHGYMNASEAGLYDLIFDKLAGTTAQEDLIIYLNFPVSLLLERIKNRGREFEIKHHSKEYLLGLEKSIQTYIEKVKSRKGKVLEYTEENFVNILLDTSGRKEEILTQIRSYISTPSL